MPVHTFPHSRLEKPTIPIATQERLPRTYYTQYVSPRIRTTGVSQLEEKINKEKKKHERKERKDSETKQNIKVF